MLLTGHRIHRNEVVEYTENDHADCLIALVPTDPGGYAAAASGRGSPDLGRLLRK